jgi:hypothetical protein
LFQVLFGYQKNLSLSYQTGPSFGTTHLVRDPQKVSTAWWRSLCLPMIKRAAPPFTFAGYCDAFHHTLQKDNIREIENGGK